ncbi:MAG: GMC family oxidoreductase N-terminal domain-containing protein [Bacteroidota bacterium]
MFQLSQRETEVLQAVCDCLIPSIKPAPSQTAQPYWQRKASDLSVHHRIIHTLESLTKEEQSEFKLLVRFLSSPFLGLSWWGPLRPFDKLSFDQQTRLLQSWSSSRLADLRKGFTSLKKLSALYYFGGSDSAGQNPNWQELSYPGAVELSGSPDELGYGPSDPFQQKDWSCDVVVVGSGAGGSIVAAELAAAGQKVIIVEKGSFCPPSQMTMCEEDMMGKLYDSKAALVTVSGNMSVLAGSCVGGGTTINWAGSFRTPDDVLEEWANEHGNPHFLSSDYQKGFAYMEQKTCVEAEVSKHNLQNQALWDGCEKLGYQAKIIARNVRQPEGIDAETSWKMQGYSSLGDRLGIKQSALHNFLADAMQKDATLLADTLVERVLMEQGRAVGVRASAHTVDGKRQRFDIRAKRVVVAAGSIHTPALLLRSGLQHPQLGRNLYLHPTTIVPAYYGRPSDPWFGPMMSVVCDAFTHLDGKHGVKLETPPVHPGFMGVSMNWKNGADFKQQMLHLRESASFIVLTRDKHGGQVRVDKEGRPRIHYQLHPYDKKHMLRGVEEACRIHHAAGAKRIQLLHQKATQFESTQGTLEAYLKMIPTLDWSDNRYLLGTAHQMGSCRMGGSDKDHPLQPDGALRGVKGLFVADASAFPSASGANPMLSIQTLAYYISQQLKATL